MKIRVVIGAAIAAAAVVGGIAQRLDAQSMSTLTNAKRVASNAVAATNEHTAKEQLVGDAAAQPASKPAAKPAGKSGAPAKSVAASGRKAAAKSPAAAKPSGAARSPGAASPGAKSSTSPDDTPEKGPGSEITLLRESFSYSVEGRRDPFVSLIASGELRPMISDLRLVAVIFDPAGRSVAIMRDMSTQEQYRVKAGQTLGRMRVTRIDPKTVTFTIEEYGFSRQQMLALNDTTRARSQ